MLGFWPVFWSITLGLNEASLVYTSEKLQKIKMIKGDLMAANENYKLMFELAADPMWLIVNDYFVSANHAAAKVLGYESAEELVHIHPSELSPERQPDGQHSFNKAAEMMSLAHHNGYISFEWVHKKKNGENFLVEVSLTSIPHAKDKVLYCVWRDISERKNAEKELLIAAAAFESQEAMTVTDADGLILRVNKAFTQVTGYTQNEVIGQSPRILRSRRHDKDFYIAMWDEILNKGAWDGEIWNRHKRGQIYPAHLIITAVRSKEGVVTNYVATFTDITENKAAAEAIESLAFYDPLTHLPNRRLLLERVQHALSISSRSGEHSALLFLDLDHFKTLNDTLGHEVGDLLLQQVAGRLTGCVRKTDTVARLGGDEFVVLLEDLSDQDMDSATQVKNMGNKILARLSEPYQLENNLYNGSSSIGITLFGKETICADELLKQADIAMYQAKSEGRNGLRFFDPKMQDAINKRVNLEHDLRVAIEQQQFEMYYQIQVNENNQPLGAEALIRWHHPEHGLLYPDTFITVLEETGLILPIGQWVIDRACAQLKIWQQDLLTQRLSISINVSAKQFCQHDFVQQVKATIANHGINPEFLNLELTESLLLHNIEETIADMNALQAVGVRFELDDFGTGYSSLQYLKRLPLYQLKIDQLFVSDITSNSSDQAIVRTIIAMAKSLMLEVIAEGVETEVQREELLHKGCTRYQGYLFGRPVPIEEFEALLNKS